MLFSHPHILPLVLRCADSIANLRYVDAAEMYIVAHKLDYWVFNNIQPSFVTNNVAIDESKEFWDLLLQVPGNSYTRYADFVSEQYYLLFVDSKYKQDAKTAQIYYQKMIEIAPWLEERVKFAD